MHAVIVFLTTGSSLPEAWAKRELVLGRLDLLFFLGFGPLPVGVADEFVEHGGGQAASRGAAEETPSLLAIHTRADAESPAPDERDDAAAPGNLGDTRTISCHCSPLGTAWGLVTPLVGLPTERKTSVILA